MSQFGTFISGTSIQILKGDKNTVQKSQIEKSTIILSDFMTNLIKLFYVYMEKYLF